MLKIASKLTAEVFIDTCRINQLTLLHQAVLQADTQAVKHLVKLPYFK
jgi:hypothetical protein